MLCSARTWAQELTNRAQRGEEWVERNRWLRAPALTAKRIGPDNLPTFAAAISFQFVISLIPLLAVMTVGASFFVNADALAAQVVEVTGGIAPESESLLGTIVQSVTDLRGQVGVISFLGLLWTGSTVFTTLRRGLNVAVGARQRRRYLQSRLVDLGVAALTGVMLAISVALTAGLSLLQQTEVLGPTSPLATLGLLLRMLTVLVPVVMTTGIFALLFGVLPAQPLPRREALLAGGLAAVLFEVGKNAFVWYVSSFGNFNLVYGPLAALVVLLLWLYYCSLIVLGAAAIGSEIARPVRPDMPRTPAT
ncbi:MAG: YihY/virulence factor BrkB family protein [Chloroflexi bacterium]|nr:YihY/virulence factor BrkB family protein [Chloroflexota bacterium]